MTTQFSGFAAVGDSFTEGMDDCAGDGRYRGWADRVASRLAEGNPELAYANLAVRGRLFDVVVDEQVPAALRLRPDLVSFAAGGNDALRTGFNAVRIATRLHEAVRVLTASGAHVLLFTSPLPSRIPGNTLLRNRVASLNDQIGKVAKRHDATMVDLWNDPGFGDPRMWSDDRLHLSCLGHLRVAGHVCAALDVEPDPAWEQPLPQLGPAPWFSRRREDLAWARAHLAPWVRRRFAGRSSGDDRTPKRPELTPIHNEGT